MCVWWWFGHTYNPAHTLNICALAKNARAKNIHNSNSPSTLKSECLTSSESRYEVSLARRKRDRITRERKRPSERAHRRQPARSHHTAQKIRAASNISHYRRYLPPFSVMLLPLMLMLCVFALLAVCLSANLFWILWKTFRTLVHSLALLSFSLSHYFSKRIKIRI